MTGWDWTKGARNGRADDLRRTESERLKALGDRRRRRCDADDDDAHCELPTTLAEAHALILAFAEERAPVEAGIAFLFDEIAGDAATGILFDPR
ncbi:hypothetical protein P0R31_40085 [Bradyrhizobium yuanmingense]|uniref:hypothetical protein n=1 Tax=Bradyrhizobium yuanmingense TaxID=108015 RepID=UPI0023B92C2E|nr:hypothetical protein [Bradyrhizobium yuanmingense]MDF0523377.1 hypothetical protein [Bradyrhizobium yuanmingense]